MILPKANLITEATVIWCHENVAHSGRSMALDNFQKNGLWVINANSVVQRTILRCVTCCRLRGVFGYQKMADLPKDRRIEAPPFTHCRVDICGTFVIQERTSDLKQYCALFTYFAHRTVHIEDVNAMDTDSFIQTWRRFIARRRTIWFIRSDNEINFVGTSNGLKKALDEMNHEQIRQHLLESETDWVKWQQNSPGASYIGGIWECHIRSARAILEGLLKTHGSSLNDENLRKVITETEATINPKPVTVETLSDVNSEMPLSPSHLLTMTTDVILAPCATFLRPDIYSHC